MSARALSARRGILPPQRRFDPMRSRMPVYRGWYWSPEVWIAEMMVDAALLNSTAPFDRIIVTGRARSMAQELHYKPGIIELLLIAKANSAGYTAAYDVARLSRAQRFAFSLNRIEGLTLKQVGQIMEVEKGTARDHVREARRRLLQLLTVSPPPLETMKMRKRTAVLAKTNAEEAAV